MMGWQWHQLDHMQIICTSLQTDNHTSTSPLSFYRLDAMHHRLKWFIHLRAQGLSKGDEHPTNTPRGVWYSLPYLYHLRAFSVC